MESRVAPDSVQTTAGALLQQLIALDSDLSLNDLFRVGFLLTQHADPTRLSDAHYLKEVWIELTLRLQAAADQQAAVTEELEAIANTDPQKFTPQQIWTLIKAIKVLSQTLEFYSK
jgi:hypothetical protein